MKRRKHTQEIEENEDNKDRLSDLSECVLLHILSFLNVKDAVQTCLLSSRWKHLWKRLPTLTLYFYPGFEKFLNQILSLRDASMAVDALDFLSGYEAKPDLLERIVRYAVSHNVNRLRLSCDIEHIPPSLFSCSSLTSLEIEPGQTLVKFPNFLNLPALTYLKLHGFSFCSGNDGHFEPFSAFNRLNTLILYECIVPDAQTLFILSTTLLNLSIQTHCYFGYYLNIELCAPNLCTFAFNGRPFMKISGSNLLSVEQVTIDLYMPNRKYSVNRLILLNWLIELVNIKSLTVTERTLEVPTLNSSFC